MTDPITRAWLAAGHESERDVIAREWPELHAALEQHAEAALAREVHRVEAHELGRQWGQLIVESMRKRMEEQ